MNSDNSDKIFSFILIFLVFPNVHILNILFQPFAFLMEPTDPELVLRRRFFHNNNIFPVRSLSHVSPISSSLVLYLFSFYSVLCFSLESQNT